jgi:hypothetical protein
MDVEVLTGPQGGGKSTVMRNEAMAMPGLYLFALPTIELIEEQSAEFSKANKLFETQQVHSQSGRGSVERRLNDALDDFTNRRITHGVIFITHETLMTLDLARFAGWHARIDEAPAAIQAGKFNIGVSTRTWLKDSFDIDSVPDNEWSALRLKVAKPKWTAVKKDQGAQGLGDFIKHGDKEGRLFVKATSWDEKEDIHWFQMWTPLALSHFASVQIAGSSYTSSVGYRAAKAIFADMLSFNEREIAPSRTGQPTISIHYLTRGHEGSTTFWGTADGRLRIKQCCDALEAHLPASGYWSGNEVVQHLMEHRAPGSLIAPMAMGLNKHRAAEACAFIFSGKATPADEPIMSAFGLTKDEIRAAREEDAITQFVMRGAIRDSDYDGQYTIYLYEEGQATRLQGYLTTKVGFTTVDITPLVSGDLMDTKRAKRVRTEVTPEEQEARKLDRAVKAKARSQTNRDRKKAVKEA